MGAVAACAICDGNGSFLEGKAVVAVGKCLKAVARETILLGKCHGAMAG